MAPQHNSMVLPSCHVRLLQIHVVVKSGITQQLWCQPRRLKRSRRSSKTFTVISIVINPPSTTLFTNDVGTALRIFFYLRFGDSIPELKACKGGHDPRILFYLSNLAILSGNYKKKMTKSKNPCDETRRKQVKALYAGIYSKCKCSTCCAYRLCLIYSHPFSFST